MVQIK